MTIRKFQEELALLKEHAAEFATKHPALAPMLGGRCADPDVERLFEGVAFQNALLREKLEDDFPELVNDLSLLFCPQFMRPVPATTVVAFSPYPNMARSITVPAGAQLGSLPISGVSCLFRTCCDVELHPLQLVDATFSQSIAEAPVISLSFALNGLSAADWNPHSVRFFLCGEYPAATDLYRLLRRYLRRIIITPEEGGGRAELPPECLVERGLSGDDPVIPYPPQAFPGYRLLQEYFLFPCRFLFFDLVGWGHWRDRGSGSRFVVRLELETFPGPPPRVRRESFALFAVPAINLFSHEAVPILLDHCKERYLIRPDGVEPDQADIFSVDAVTGLYAHGARTRFYRPFALFETATRAEPVFHVSVTKSPVSGDMEHYLSVAYPAAEVLPEPETLSISLTCTNASLPERLRIGDVCHVTGSSPEFTAFRNITGVTPSLTPPMADNSLWRLVSLLSLNMLPLASAANLRALMSLLLLEGRSGDRGATAANRNRIEGIEAVTCVASERLARGIPMRGREIAVRVRGDAFAGPGDLFLFGSVLDRFFSGYATLNSFTRLTLDETLEGEQIQWQPRLGNQPLL